MRHEARHETDSATPLYSEAWLFAQELLGNPILEIHAAAGRASEERAKLAWLAEISPRHADELRRLENQDIEARRNRESLIWAAGICDSAAAKLRNLVREEAEAAHAGLFQSEAMPQSHLLSEWDPSQPRVPAGRPDGGQFASSSGSSSAGAAAAPTTGSNRELAKDVTNSQSKQVQVTKSHLPADRRGTWVRGAKGDGVFRYNNSAENQAVGMAGREVRFENGYIGIGGFPSESYYQGSAEIATVHIKTVTATSADSSAADAMMREKLGNPNWERPNGYRWNHAGGPGSKTMELVDTTHIRVAHKGSAATPRAEVRAANVRGATGRAMGALTVYLTSRDALRATGVLQPDYEVDERETYHFRAEDGSVFVVHPAGWFSQARKEYVAGPRKGHLETITDAQVDEHRKQAEAEFGKYISGSLFTEPRFIPGRQRKSLPLITYPFGIPHEAGWIDEKGVHRYPVPKALPI
jgi:hypothetical protein